MKLCDLFTGLLLSIFVSVSALAQSPPPFLPDAFYIKIAVFALDPIPDKKGLYRIAAYLPHGTLIFKEKNPVKLPPIGDVEYIPVISQNGDRLLVPSKYISLDSFAHDNRPKTIVFHEDEFLCGKDNRECDREDAEITIGKGWVFEKIGDDPVALRGSDQGNIIDGFVTRSQFERWKSQGVLTDTSQGYPRYYVREFQKLGALSTECGVKKDHVSKKSLIRDLEVSLEPAKLLSVFTRLSDILGLGLKISGKKEFEESDSIGSSYGTDDTKMEFFKLVISVLDKSTGEGANRELLVTAEMFCTGVGRSAKEVAIKSVQVNEDNEIIAKKLFSDFYSTKIATPISDHDPAFNVYNLGGYRPFLTSVTRASYPPVVHEWNHNLDRDIAAILMHRFNVSCPNKVTGGENPLQRCGHLLKPLE